MSLNETPLSPLSVKNDWYAVILAGGNGTRFWPRSRTTKPKQFLPIVGDTPMIHQTYQRIAPIIPRSNIYVVANRSHKSLVLDSLPDLPEENLLLEPCGRNTAPGITWVSMVISDKSPDATIAILPSDHYIPNTTAYRETLQNAFEISHATGEIVTLGIRPDRPETGYGYIQTGSIAGSIHDCTYYHVRRFVEKPDLPTAQSYLSSGDFLWNSGMFVSGVRRMLMDIERFQPDIYSGIREIIMNAGTPGILETRFDQLPKISIDYAVMEKTTGIITVPIAFIWSDVGSWEALYQHLPQDSSGNCSRGAPIMLCCENTLTIGGERLIVAMGLKDIMIIDTSDAVLVCHRDVSQQVGAIVNVLSADPDRKKYL